MIIFRRDVSAVLAASLIEAKSEMSLFAAHPL